MRRIALTMVLILSIILTFVSTGYSREKNAPVPTKTTAKSASKVLEPSGFVTWCDTDGKYVMIHSYSAGKQLSFELNKKTQIKKGETKIKFSELKKGDRILVEY